eukprot:Rhum_TRINITY_DN14611_c45_g1::Rhum_TRINITY_DN14611_c45_g1_i1::g.103531::m.103531
MSQWGRDRKMGRSNNRQDLLNFVVGETEGYHYSQSSAHSGGGGQSAASRTSKARSGGGGGGGGEDPLAEHGEELSAFVKGARVWWKGVLREAPVVGQGLSIGTAEPTPLRQQQQSQQPHASPCPHPWRTPDTPATPGAEASGTGGAGAPSQGSASSMSQMPSFNMSL